MMLTLTAPEGHVGQISIVHSEAHDEPDQSQAHVRAACGDFEVVAVSGGVRLDELERVVRSLTIHER
jgi:hypothetical protein